MTKRIAVSMSDDCAAILKEYAAFFGVTQSEAMYELARASIHNHAINCKKVSSMLEMRDKSLDKRAGKPCYTGYSCLACKHRTACTAGVYKGLYEPIYPDLIKPGSPCAQLMEQVAEAEKTTEEA